MKNILLLSLLLLMLSCIEQKPKQHSIAAGIHAEKIMRPVANPNVITINQENHETVPYTELRNVLKEVKYIPLVSKEPIGEMDKVLIYKDKIFVLDAYKAKKVFIFNMQGEIINIIDRQGRGPEEYPGLSEMCISQEEDCIVLNTPRNIFYFSFDGKFIRKEGKITNDVFAIMGNSIINQVYKGQSVDPNWHLAVTTKGDSIISRGFPFYPIQIRAAPSKSLSSNSMGEMLFVPNLSDTIYQILNDSTYMVKYIVKQKKSIWEKYDREMDGKQTTDLMMNSNYTRLSYLPIMETERFVHISIVTKRSLVDKYYLGFYDYWYDKTKRFVFHLQENGYGNLLQPIYHVIPSPKATYGNYFVGLINNSYIEAFQTNLAQPAYNDLFKNEELKSLIKSATPDLEAILVLYEFK